jgi:hypothetical protein
VSLLIGLLLRKIPLQKIPPKAYGASLKITCSPKLSHRSIDKMKFSALITALNTLNVGAYQCVGGGHNTLKQPQVEKLVLKITLSI